MNIRTHTKDGKPCSAFTMFVRFNPGYERKTQEGYKNTWTYRGDRFPGDQLLNLHRWASGRVHWFKVCRIYDNRCGTTVAELHAGQWKIHEDYSHLFTQ